MTRPITKFAGIDNRTPADRLAPKERGGPQPVRDAVNVDLSVSGTFQRRPGMTRVIAGENVRCLHGRRDGMLYAVGNRLNFFDGVLSHEAGELASAYTPVAYADTPLGTAWSDGYRLNLFDGASSKRLAPALPNPMPSLTVSADGALPAGTYGVMFTASRPDGTQSAPSAPTFVDVPEGGAITVSSTGHTERIDVFVTAVDGSVFYREVPLPVGDTSVRLPILHGSGQTMTLEVFDDLPAGTILALHKGKLLSADGPALYFSLPWTMGVYRPAVDYLLLPEDITLVAPTDGGVYLATASETWWAAGGDIASASLSRIESFGAVRGTLTAIPNSPDLMWFTPRGPVRATPGGQLTALQDDNVAFPAADRGASVWRESNGLRQFISAISSNPSIPPGAAVAGSYMDAEVIKP